MTNCFNHIVLLQIAGSSDPIDNSYCGSTTSAVLNVCNETSVASDAFYFDWSPCHTPEVHTISPTMGPATDSLTISGSGFSTTACQNEVMIGDKNCTVTSATENTITCLINTENNMAIGVFAPVEVRVNNIGNALMTDPTQENRHFILIPHINDVSPSSGSTAGGAIIVISGGGFTTSNIAVSINAIACTVLEVTYDTVVCMTSNANVLTANITLSVYVNGQSIPAECRGSCEYSYSSADTPTISSVSPSTITAADTQVSISGTGFGTDVAALNISIGNTPCSILTTTGTSITCNAGRPISGTQSLSLVVDVKGLAVNSAGSLTITGSVSTISPSSGAINGQTSVTISGFGFDETDTSVTVGGSACVIGSISAQQIVCSTPAGSAGDVNTVVTTNSQTLTAVTFTYSDSNTPVVTGLSTNSANSGDSIVISGTGFGTSAQSEGIVYIGAAVCTITSASSSSITCTLGDHSAGTVDIRVIISSKGLATNSQTFNYQLTLSSILPISGKYYFIKKYI